ncbi:hypothetical protein chiPu_0005603 [Chiloscyllium punctatum]|uniref:Uncharacterized protein n=1 Tax=Chiloscyllium punctatum TaxID=137246 RepID=A0A401S9V0_CHIPU|nr:hypothetical protein [Chiloscyllium punctatum]
MGKRHYLSKLASLSQKYFLSPVGSVLRFPVLQQRLASGQRLQPPALGSDPSGVGLRPRARGSWPQRGGQEPARPERRGRAKVSAPLSTEN